MKGRQLTLQEVLNLEDGKLVLVKDLDISENEVEVGYVKDDGELKIMVFGGYFPINDMLNYPDVYDKALFYEWT